MKKIKFEQQNSSVKTLYYLKIYFKRKLLKIDLSEFLRFTIKMSVYIALLIHTFYFVYLNVIENFSLSNLSLFSYLVITFYILYNLLMK